jgi:hypothetical protein
MNGMKRGIETLPLRLDVVAELVNEDQRDEPDPERPAPDQRVGGDRDEQAEELEREHAELHREPDHGQDRRPQLPEQALPARFRVDRLVVAEIGLELRPWRELAHSK